MPDGLRKPPAPCVEDYDSDQSAAIPDTRRDARTPAAAPTKPLVHMHKPRRDAASDSGYSSHTSNTAASSAHSQPVAAGQSATQRSHPSGPPMNQPSLQRTESQKNPSRPSRTPSISRPPMECNDPHCKDPTCKSSRNAERSYVLPHRPQAQQPPQPPLSTQYPVQDPGVPNPYNQAPHYAYPQMPAGQSPSYASQPIPRARASSTARARPESWAPGSNPAAANMYQYSNIPQQPAYNTQQHGPPPSPSAYRNSYLAQHPRDWQAMISQMPSGSPQDPSGSYLPGYGAPMASNNQGYPPAIPPIYSARQSNHAASGQDVPGAMTIQQSSQPAISARRRSDMPGSYPGQTLDSESSSESSSSSEDSEEEVERAYRQREKQRRERERAHRALEDKKAMPPPPSRRRDSRPPLPHTRTMPADVRRRSRDPPRRAPYSDPNMSSEYDEPARSSRPTMDKRLTYDSSREPRRPAITHHSSSGRSSSRSFSHAPREPQQYVVEDANGRKRYYDSLELAQAKAHRLKEQQHIDEAEAYQSDRRGNTHVPTLTAESIKRTQAQQQQERRPASHVSGSSRKSATSSRHSVSESTIQIKRGDTTFTIPANATLEVRKTEGGETFFFGSSSPPRETSYHGGSSKSSGSRHGRSKHGSDIGSRRDTITDGYEPGF